MNAAQARFQRACWLALVFASLLWGGISGAAFSLNGFPLTPSAALMGAFGLIGLALTLFVLGRAAGQDGREGDRGD